MRMIVRITLSFALVAVLATITAPTARAQNCAADLDGNGRVNLLDLSQVLDNAGVCSSPDCPEDLNGNGFVGDGDAYASLGAFHAGLFVCTCRADLDGDRDVDEDDVDVLISVFLLDCRVDVDRSGFVHDNDIEIAVLGFVGDPDSDDRADVDENGVVNILDIVQVIDTLGRDCRADLNGDGIVDILDFGTMFALAGPC